MFIPRRDQTCCGALAGWTRLSHSVVAFFIISLWCVVPPPPPPPPPRFHLPSQADDAHLIYDLTAMRTSELVRPVPT